ncbi:response regulator [Duganella sp. LX47W]|uniref:Response regulator n=2 Tax=Rugamonas apoptosis TaxID=2758570 RepID=A0A7W2ING0_9BURK|nr:response regulator [Rugamonas apoptosis]
MFVLPITQTLELCKLSLRTMTLSLRSALHQAQVVVSDQRMPGMNGTEFLSCVKQLSPGTMRIILSGYTEIESILGAINCGEIYRFHTKPWDEAAMRERIRKAFQYHQMIHGMLSEG